MIVLLEVIPLIGPPVGGTWRSVAYEVNKRLNKIPPYHYDDMIRRFFRMAKNVFPSLRLFLLTQAAIDAIHRRE